MEKIKQKKRNKIKSNENNYKQPNKTQHKIKQRLCITNPTKTRFFSLICAFLNIRSYPLRKLK